MDCCCESAEEIDPSVLRERVRTFLADRSGGAVTGPRRYGREPLVEYVAGVARSEGRRVAVLPGEDPAGADTLIFRHWRDIDEALVASAPGADVLCGQDLCHQVPAVMRLNRVRFRQTW